MTRTDTRPIFVYGTLKEGGRLASSFDHLRTKVTPATIKGYMFNINGGFPACRFNRFYSRAGLVHGELHSYDRQTEVIEHMDRIEGCHGNDPRNMYNRVLVKVTTESGEEVEAWTYEWNGDTDWAIIKDGIWKI